MNPIDYNDVIELGDHRMGQEASTLGLRPGQWPTQIPAAPRFGNGCALLLTRVDADCTHVYKQEFGIITLHVWND